MWWLIHQLASCSRICNISSTNLKYLRIRQLLQKIPQLWNVSWYAAVWTIWSLIWYSPICLMFATTPSRILKNSLLSGTVLRLRWDEPFSTVFLFFVCVGSEGHLLINRCEIFKAFICFALADDVGKCLNCWLIRPQKATKRFLNSGIKPILTIADPKSWPVYEWWVVGYVVTAASKLSNATA